MEDGVMESTRSMLPMQLSASQVSLAVRGLPSLPGIVLELLQTIDLHDTTMQFVANKISHDQALTATVLRLANSSFYGRPSRVSNIQQAIVMLGLGTTRSLVVAAAMTASFHPGSTVGFAFATFWRHAIGTAVSARGLAPGLRVSPDTAFIAGLLHDIGQLAMATCFPAECAAIQAWREREGCAMRDAEHAITGVDHAAVGAALAAHWRFPLEIQEAVGGHHDVHAGLPLVIQLADQLAHALELGTEGAVEAGTIDDVVRLQTGLAPDRFEKVVGRIKAEHASICQTLLQ
jgi:putative nucleotidyltransferase with HDIG domain